MQWITIMNNLPKEINVISHHIIGSNYQIVFLSFLLQSETKSNIKMHVLKNKLFIIHVINLKTLLQDKTPMKKMMYFFFILMASDSVPSKN